MVILGTIWNLIWVAMLIWQVYTTIELKRWSKERDKRIVDELNTTQNIYTEIRDMLKDISKK